MRLLDALGLEGRVIELVVLALEGDGAVGIEEEADDLHGLLEAIQALLQGGEGPAEGGVLALEPGSADADVHAAAAHVVHGRDHLGDEGGVAVRVARHERAQADALGDGGESREEGVGLERRDLIAEVADGREEVVVDPEAGPSARIDGTGDGGDVLPAGGVVVELGADLHSG